ncbi:MAG: TrkA C-terminal domain-containing protein [Micropruina sp.]|uniref:aspartate:alanine exchanger family transporter n=1 Tax=Micropruina sp. TaxID=2737536 RepID=UPI0039E36B4F
MFFAFLEQYPMLLFAVLLVLGALLGQVKIAGATLGPAAVLFVALGLTAWGITQGVELTVPEVLGNFGLMVFTYTVGIISGPNFFGSLRRGWPVMLTTVGCVAVAALVGGLAGSALGLPQPVIAGTFAGALTNTPALAAASQVAGEAELPAVGYSISYLWGVIGMMLAAAWALRRGAREGASGSPRLEQRTVRVDQEAGPTIGELLKEHDGAVAVTRVKHTTGPMLVASPDEPLGKGDLVSIVGPAEALASVTSELGHVSSIDIIGDRTDLDSNRVTLSIAKFAGHRLEDLDLGRRFGAHVTRVRRGDVDMIPTPDFLLQLGDRLRVVAPRDQIRAVRGYLGDSERGFSDINPLGLALGLTIGVAIGMIPIPLPTGSFTLGSAAGTLLAGLVFARIGRVGRVPISMPTAAAHALSALGMLVFLAFAGTKAGLLFADAMSSSLGWKVALLGFLITVVAAAALLLVGRLQRTDWIQLSGQLAGAQTQPALLAFANTRTGFDTRVSLGYALVYPAAMVGKILLAQLLVLIG